MTTYYKLTDPGGVSCNGGSLTWPLPRGKHPGKWVKIEGEPVLCERGFHAVTADHVLDWQGQEVWEIELGGTIVADSNGTKVVASRARLVRLVMDEAALRHFGVWCAAQVLPIFERRFPADDRVRRCLVVCGPWSSAAARATAKDAAWAATRAAQTRRLKLYLTAKVDLTKPVRLPAHPTKSRKRTGKGK